MIQNQVLIWADVVGYEGYYRVSHRGDVMRVKAGRNARVGKILKASPQTKGYLTVGLSKDGKTRMHLVHRLVLSAFVGSIPWLQCNHKDLNKKNNSIDNLEYMTPSQNVNHYWDSIAA
jgi:HNH endonuclease/NUMOD4 motif-containing protein